MDQLDMTIVSLLAKNGRLSFRDLGAAVGLSSNAAGERYRRLLAEGVIRDVRARLNLAALGRPLEVLIDVKLRPEISADQFEAALRDLPQVREATLMTGSFDYTVRVACADREDLVRVTEALRGAAGARETYSRLILREIDLSSAEGG